MKNFLFTKKITTVIVLVLFFCISAFIVSGIGNQENSPALKVVTTTSLIAHIVERVGKEKVDVVNIIPPAQCPGHFDVKPGDIQKLSDAYIFFLHGWQGEKFSRQLIAAADNPDLTVVKLDIEGNWMTPPVQQEAVNRVKEALIKADAGNSSYYEAMSEKYRESITFKETEIKAKMAGVNLSEVKVLCADMQTGFIKWIGLTIVAAYGRPDSLTPGVVKELVDKGRAENISLVIDNLQSGKDAGAGIAEELGCSRVILSNFPGGFDNTETWEKAIDCNIKMIMEAVIH
jgi:zinc transport system substrate-binding protein